MTGIFESIYNFLMDIFASIFTLVSDLLIFLLTMIFEAVMTVVNGLIATIDMSSVGSAMEAIPPEVWNFAYRIGLADVSGIVAGALMIKFTLQLIPFIRVGSK